MKYLGFYNKCINAGKMVYTSALCDHFSHYANGEKIYDPLFEIMIPTFYDMNQISLEGKTCYCWASDSSEYLFHEFTPLRQNIVLLMAAMNGEL